MKGKRAEDLKVADLECSNLIIFVNISLCNTFMYFDINTMEDTKIFSI